LIGKEVEDVSEEIQVKTTEQKYGREFSHVLKLLINYLDVKS